jgi:hypothetical protein
MSTTIHDAQTSHAYRFMCNFQLASSDSAQQDLQALSAEQDTLILTRTMRSIGIVEYNRRCCKHVRGCDRISCSCAAQINRRIGDWLLRYTGVLPSSEPTPFFSEPPGGYPVCIQPSARVPTRSYFIFSFIHVANSV